MSVEADCDLRVGGTRLTIIQRGFPTRRLRDEFEGGWASILDGLGRVVTAR
jgi:hypothetical protein